MKKEVIYRKLPNTSPHGGWLSGRELFLLLLVVFLYVLIIINAPLHGQDDIQDVVGFRSFNYGGDVNSTPTGEKPESKLWWNDSFWWGSLWDPLAESYSIHRFNPFQQNWESTGVRIDDRSSSKADALWDGENLYVVSHIFTKSPGPTTESNYARLYRYSYHETSNCFEADEGFPVAVNGSKSEALVVDKDSNGILWITWVENGQVMINRSLDNDRNWGTPFPLPGQGAALQNDDISSLVAFDNKIGVMWSNHADEKTYFAVHLDGDPDSLWQAREEALADDQLGPVSDDHINLKASNDGSGNIFAVTKTSIVGSGPLLFVLKRDAFGNWTRGSFGDFQFNHTRPILLLDEDSQQVHVFAMSDYTGENVIYMKSADQNAMQFPAGLGTPVIQNPIDTRVNNVTSTKQCISEESGMLILASDNATTYYLHNFIANEINATQEEFVSDMKLFPNFPNPFNESTIIHFDISEVTGAGPIEANLTVYNSIGQKVKSLFNDGVEAGCYDVRWSGRGDDGTIVPSGVYFAILKVAGRAYQQKLVLLK